jgi:hypothetical protein
MAKHAMTGAKQSTAKGPSSPPRAVTAATAAMAQTATSDRASSELGRHSPPITPGAAIKAKPSKI